MKYTRKTFIDVSKILNDYYSTSPVEISEFKYMVMDFVDLFKNDNPNFDEQRFLDEVYK